MLTVAILGQALSGCGGDSGPRDGKEPVPAAESSTPSEAARSDAPRLTGKANANLHLWISNQSFRDDPVAVTVSVDGVLLVDQSFDVESQHNWILFPVRLPAGAHQAEAVSETGEVMKVRFRVPEDAIRYAVINYWHSPGEARHFDWRIQPNPVFFA